MGRDTGFLTLDAFDGRVVFRLFPLALVNGVGGKKGTGLHPKNNVAKAGSFEITANRQLKQTEIV
jgi:hypothetical protein